MQSRWLSDLHGSTVAFCLTAATALAPQILFDIARASVIAMAVYRTAAKKTD
ncbi:MAG: hypothetical protein RIF32_04545 [Leptospirales bacterium]